MQEAMLNHLIQAVAGAVIAHADELSALDAAIGDGDHGHNMRRGAEAVLAELPNLLGQPMGAVLRACGVQVVMKVGGASGPLVGTLLMELGKHLPPAPGHEDFANALEAAVVAVKGRGKSGEGQKTMLDVLGPVLRGVRTHEECAGIKQLAAEAAIATIPLKATRGRASFLGERSIGHMDPGARSTSLMIGTVCDELSLARAGK